MWFGWATLRKKFEGTVLWTGGLGLFPPWLGFPSSACTSHSYFLFIIVLLVCLFPHWAHFIPHPPRQSQLVLYKSQLAQYRQTHCIFWSLRLRQLVTRADRPTDIHVCSKFPVYLKPSISSKSLTSTNSFSDSSMVIQTNEVKLNSWGEK